MKSIILSLFICFNVFTSIYSQNGWTQLANYPGSGSAGVYGMGFQEYGLAGQGYYSSGSSCYKDWWQYSPGSNTWVSKTSLTGSKRYAQSGFSTDNYAYVCLGSDGSGYFRDLWQYDHAANTWTQKANFPGIARYGAIAQSIGTKAYVGLGERDNSGGIYDYFTDFYEYDETTDTWTAKATFPGQGRLCAFSFLINNVIYVVAGRSENNYNWVYLKDMWAYNIANNTWAQKTSYPGNGSFAMGGFVLGQYAYVGTGLASSTAYKDFWRYNPQADTWTQLPDFPGSVRYHTMYFQLGNTGYLGCGRNTSSATMKDFWKFEDPSASVNEDFIEENIRIYPVPARNVVFFEGTGIDFIEIYSLGGILLKRTEVSRIQSRIGLDISNLKAGLYFTRISFGKRSITKKIIKY